MKSFQNKNAGQNWTMYKSMGKGKGSLEESQSTMPNVHTNWHFTQLNLKVDRQTGSEWFMQGPNTARESVAKPGTRLQIILTVVYWSYIDEFHGNLSNRFLEKT